MARDRLQKDRKNERAKAAKARREALEEERLLQAAQVPEDDEDEYFDVEGDDSDNRGPAHEQNHTVLDFLWRIRF